MPRKVQDFIKAKGRDHYTQEAFLHNEFGQQRKLLTFLEKQGASSTAGTKTVTLLQK